MTIQQARHRAESEAGRKLDEQDFQQVLEYTRHKAKVTGHDEDYVPLLLYDEVKNRIFQDQVDFIYHEAKEAEKMLFEMMKRGEWPCVISASAIPACTGVQMKLCRS